MKLDLDSLELRLLEAGGVDNWEWYHESLSNYRNAWAIEDEFSELNESQTLAALNFGGVDNWEWYDESLGRFKEYKDYIEELPENSPYMEFNEFSEVKDREEELELNRRKDEKSREEAKAKKVSDTSVKPGEIESQAVLEVVKKISGEIDAVKLNELYFDFVKNSNILKQNAGFKKEFVESIQKECKPGGAGITGARKLYLDNISSKPKFKKFVKDYFDSK